MEDFGYKKNDSDTKLPELAKKTFLVAATIFSIACFVYITINAYYYVYKDRDANVVLIKAPEGPIKVIHEEEIVKKQGSMQIDRSVYEDIFGNAKASSKNIKAKIRELPKPAIPPNTATKDSRLIKNSAAKKDKKNQSILVYSDSKEPKTAPTDLLTKTAGKRKTTVQKRRSNKRSVLVQIAAMASKKSAEDGWKKLNRFYPKLFSGLTPKIEEVDLGKRGVFYRLQIGNFFNQIEAEEFCNRYVAQAQKSRADCILVE